MISTLDSKKLLNSLRCKTYLLTAVLATLVACSHGPVVSDFPTTANSGEEIQKLNMDVDSAVSNQVNVLSPDSFHHALEALNEAKDKQHRGKDSKDILHSVAVGRAYLSRANETATVAKTNMEEVFSARQQAIAAGAPQFLTDDFKTADKKLEEVTSNIETNDLSGVAGNRDKLQAKYLDLELKSIQHANLDQSHETMKVAIKEGAKDYAPRSLAIAEKKLKDTDAFIVANRHETDQIKARADDAQTEANHLLKITRESKGAKNVSPEDVALKLENEQNRTKSKEEQLSDSQAHAGLLAAQKDSLESDREFSRRFEEAQAEFTKSEAEVYRQGNNLVIRLKTLEFPVAKATLKGSSFPVLAKVQKVIQDFGKSSVVVEGHTDSDGSPKTNEVLSKQRAEAVTQYLVSSGAVDSSNIKSVGYGYQKPLTANKTKEGKAQNRRVDIIITSLKS